MAKNSSGVEVSRLSEVLKLLATRGFKGSIHILKVEPHAVTLLNACADWTCNMIATLSPDPPPPLTPSPFPKFIPLGSPTQTKSPQSLGCAALASRSPSTTSFVNWRNDGGWPSGPTLPPQLPLSSLPCFRSVSQARRGDLPLGVNVCKQLGRQFPAAQIPPEWSECPWCSVPEVLPHLFRCPHLQARIKKEIPSLVKCCKSDSSHLASLINQPDSLHLLSLGILPQSIHHILAILGRRSRRRHLVIQAWRPSSRRDAPHS